MGCTIPICAFFFLFLSVNGSPDIKYTTKYIDMPVDHFSFSNDYKFKLRYLENKDHWKPESGAPIFFYTGNEGDIVSFANNTGFMWEIAPHFEALIIFAEHRYYGESLPFGKESYSDKKHLGYLSSSQALADYVDLIAHIRQEYGLKRKSNPVIAFGGSYGGMLSAWIRMKYPSSVAGSLAASAPIWQFTGITPCDAFNGVVSSVFNSTSNDCHDSIRKSWKALDNLSATADGRQWLTSTFKMCEPIESKTNISALKYWLTDVYSYLAMVNYPYPANFVADLPAYPIKAVCQFLNDSTQEDKELLRSLFRAVSVYFNGTGTTKCLSVQQTSNPSISETGWDYQACTEMVMPMCDNGGNMFEKSEWNFASYSDDCFKKYGVRPQEYLVEKFYGGKSIRASSNIIFSNGLLDPWSSGGVLSSISKSLTAVVIPDGAHHLDLRSSNSADPKSVIKARKLYVKTIKKWINEHNSPRNNCKHEEETKCVN